MDFTYSDSGNVISKRAKISGARFIFNKGKSYIEDNVVIRGDLNQGKTIINWGKYTCLMKECQLVPPERKEKRYPMTLGNHVYIGANSIVEAASIGSCVVIGPNCKIGRFAVIKDCVVIEAGSVIPPFSVVASLTKIDQELMKFRPLPESAQTVIEQFCKDIHAGRLSRIPFPKLMHSCN